MCFILTNCYVIDRWIFKETDFLATSYSFLISVIALPIMIYFFYDRVDLDDGLLTTIFNFHFSCYRLGFRWLIVGELSEFFPFQKLFNALPNGGEVLLVIVFPVYISSQLNITHPKRYGRMKSLEINALMNLEMK